MKIGFFTDGYFPQINGVATAVEESAQALTSIGHEVFIVAPRYPNEKSKGNVFRMRSILVHRDFNIRMALTMPGKTIFDVARTKFDIIHGHNGGPISMGALEIARAKNIPFVFTHHTLWEHYTHYLVRGLVRPSIMKVVMRIFSNRCDVIIAPTQKVKEALLKINVKRPIFVIPSSIDTNEFRPVKKGSLRKKLGLTKEDKILLYVGRLGKEKSVDFLIRAFKFIEEENQKVHFVLVGGGPQESQLKRLVNSLKLKNVHFAGVVKHDELPAVYSDGDIFAFASTTETQGMVLIEALACGLPIVAVSDPATDGLLGKAGIITRRDESDFASKALGLLKDNEKTAELSKLAVEEASRFSSAVIAYKLEEVYKKAILINSQKNNLFNISFDIIRSNKTIKDFKTPSVALNNGFIEAGMLKLKSLIRR